MGDDFERGAQVDVPAGALSTEVELSIEQRSSPEEFGSETLPETFDAVTTVVVTPHGTTFSTPAPLSLPFSGLGDDANELVVMRLDDLNDTERELEGPVDLGDDLASVLLDDFSVYSPAAVSAGSCPGWSGADMRRWRSAAVTDGLRMKPSIWRGGTPTREVRSCNTWDWFATRAKQTVPYTVDGMSYTHSGIASAYGGASPPTTSSGTGEPPQRRTSHFALTQSRLSTLGRRWLSCSPVCRA